MTRKSAAMLLLVCVAAGGCKSPKAHREQADDVAGKIVSSKQREAFGEDRPFTIETAGETLRRRLLLAQGLPYSSPASLGSDQLTPVKHWPEPERATAGPSGSQDSPALSKDRPLVLSLTDALQVGARNSREYQDKKEDVFKAALALDLQRNEFRNILSGALSADGTADLSSGEAQTGVTSSFEPTIERKFTSGATLATGMALDLAKLITPGTNASMGVLADASMTVPLLSGAGKHIVTEPLTQAERNVLYALWRLERFRREYAVRVATSYLNVLQRHDRIANAKGNYEALAVATRRARRLAEAGMLPGVGVDEASQDELSARDRWVSERQSYETTLDSFKMTMGLPADAHIEVDLAELQRLVSETRAKLKLDERAPQAESGRAPAEPSRQGAGPMELPEDQAIRISLEHRLDLRIQNWGVEDAQRAVVVAADKLKAGLNFAASGQTGERRSSASSAESPDAQLNYQRGSYSLGFEMDLPWEKTAERNDYRNSLIALEQSVRAVQDLEDQIKLDVRDSVRTLGQARESARIQAQAVVLADRRVRSTDLLLQAGRAQVRDVLFAQQSLLSAQNALTDALRNYRVAELEIQRNMDVLEITEEGLWREYTPDGKR